MNRYCIFILTYRRAYNQKTLSTLLNNNYTGDWYLVCSDDDKQLEDYKKLYGNKVLVFHKEDTLKYTDTMDNLKKMNVVVFARNKVFDFAEELGYEYFIVLDDDYTSFGFRYEEEGMLKEKHITILISCLICI